jgi:hypothetical protein
MHFPARGEPQRLGLSLRIRLAAVIALMLVKGRLQAKNDLASYRAQRTPGRLRELPMQRFVAADSKLAAACRFLLKHGYLRSVRTLCGHTQTAKLVEAP